MMKYNTHSLLKWLFGIAYLIILFFYLFKYINPELHYHVQQPPFLANTAFFSHYLTYPGGPAEYIATFMAQFFYYGWIGSLVILLVCLIIVLSANYILKIFKGLREFNILLSVLPIIFLIALFNNYYFPFAIAVQIMLVYLFVCLFLFSNAKKINFFISYLILSTLTYYISGSAAFIIFSVSTIILIFYQYNFKKAGLFLLLVIAFTSIMPYLAFKLIFNISIITAYFSVTPDLLKNLMYEKGKMLYVFCYYLPAVLFVLAIISSAIKFSTNRKHNLSQQKTKVNLPEAGYEGNENKDLISNKWYLTKRIAAIISIIIIIGTTYISFKITENKHKKNIALADYYNYHENWNKTIDVIMSDPEYDIFLNYLFVRAIDNSGNFTDMFFNYPQLIGADVLYANKMNSPQLTMISSDYYFDLGYISEANHWAYEAMSATMHNPRVLKRLVMTNLIFGNYQAARDILSVLNDNFLYKDFVRHYMPFTLDTNLVLSDKLIMEKRALMPHHKVVLNSIEDIFLDLINRNDRNKRAQEHLAMYYLLNHKIGAFINHLPEFLMFYESKPEIFEEAILLYRIKSKQKVSIGISSNAIKIFKDYNEILENFGSDKEAAKSILFERYANTYYYYIMYNSPLVTKLKLSMQ